MLIEKDPSLEKSIQFALRQNLHEIGERCVEELKHFIAEYTSTQDFRHALPFQSSDLIAGCQMYVSKDARLSPINQSTSLPIKRCLCFGQSLIA